VFWLIVGCLFVLLLVAYFAGARKGQTWGKVLLVLCVIALVAAVLRQALCTRTEGGGGAQIAATEQERVRRAAELLGQALKERLDPGGRIFILAPENSAMGTPLDRFWTEGLSSGLQDPSWTRAGCRYLSAPAGTPAVVTDEVFSEAVAEASGEADAIVSFAGLPAGFEQAEGLRGSEGRPAVAAFFPSSGRPNLALISKWLKDGDLQAAVVEDETGVHLQTPGD